MVKPTQGKTVVQVYTDYDVKARIERLAGQERRPLSKMAGILIEEGLSARERKAKPSKPVETP